MHVRLFADEVVVVSIDARTGRLALHATGDMSTAGRASRFALISERLDAGGVTLLDALVRLRLNVCHLRHYDNVELLYNLLDYCRNIGAEGPILRTPNIPAS